MICKKSIPTNINNNDELAPGTWQSLEFYDKVPINLTLAEPYLYVAAAKDGVWRRNIAQMNTDWEYLGLANYDSTLGLLYGVAKVDIWGNDILAGLDAPIEVKKGTKVGIWRSCDNGKTWAISDTGIRTPIYHSSVICDLKSSPRDPFIVLAGYGVTFRSSDRGAAWQFVFPDRRDAAIFVQRYSWHPKIPSLVWAYGSTPRETPSLARSIDGGVTWEICHPRVFLRFQALSLSSLDFDCSDSDIMYLATTGGIFKSTNSGQDWLNNDENIRPILINSTNNIFGKILCHPIQSDVFFVVSVDQLYLSTNGGNSFYLLTSPNKEDIFTLEFDRLRDMLYIGAADGIFRLKNPLSAPRIPI